MLSTLPDVVIGVVVIMLVLSASMSTLASLVLTSASTLTLDFIKGTVVKDLSEKKQMIWLRVLVAVFLLISVILAIDPPTFIAQLMGIKLGRTFRCFPGAFPLWPLLEAHHTCGSLGQLCYWRRYHRGQYVHRFYRFCNQCRRHHHAGEPG